MGSFGMRPPVDVSVDMGTAQHSADRPWSASAIEDFLGCPLRYWWQRVQRWSTPTSVAQVVGTIVHGMLEELMALPPEERLPDTAMELLKQSYRTEIEKPENAHLDRAALRDGCTAAVESYWRTEAPADITVAPDGLERPVPAELRGLPFIGYVDRLSETDLGLRVTDYKTGAGKPAYWWPKWRQQLLYSAALAHVGLPVAEVQLLFLKDERAITRPVYDAAVRRSLDDLEAAHEQRAGMLEAEIWEARPSKLCDYCDFRVACPAMRSKSPTPGTQASDEQLEAAGLSRKAEGIS